MKIYEHTVPSARGHGMVSVSDHDAAGVSITTRSAGFYYTTGITLSREQALDMARAIMDHLRASDDLPVKAQPSAARASKKAPATEKADK